MKRHLRPRRPHPWILFGLLLVPAAALQAAGPVPIAQGAPPLETVARLVLPPVDHDALLAEDLRRAGPGVPLRFAQPHAVFHTPDTSGTWDLLDDGSELWRLRIESHDAVSLSFGFGRFHMPEGGSLVVYTADGGELVGPFTAADNEVHGQLWTPLLPGGEAVIEVRLPAERRGDLGLELTSINHGYRDPFRIEKSGACNIDVACPAGNAWRPQIRSVARIVISGAFLCTGFMVNNVAQDLRPLFMTADHCGLDAGNAPSLVVYWNFVNPTCRTPGSGASGGPGSGSLNQSQTGSTFLAGSPVSDFTLVELDDEPNRSHNVYWAGWDARAGDASRAIAVHHPQGDEKRISFENDSTTTTSYLGTAVPGDGSHARVIDWDEGTTEPGSSGSPLFNQRGRVIGQLHGGFAACGNDLSDWYGRMSRSWGLGLRQHLDPGNTGTRFIDGRDQSGGPPPPPPPPPPPGGFECVADDTTLCLNEGRFQVKLAWRDFIGLTGNGHVVLDSDDSGLLWFFSDDNWEMLVKVLNGCGFNDHFWVFASASTDVEYTLTVTDSETGDAVSYTNEIGTPSPAITDTQAFATCP